ncbi:MAG: hypothetical protein WCK34_14380, partial [Bacteroidota bacterium]
VDNPESLCYRDMTAMEYGMSRCRLLVLATRAATCKGCFSLAKIVMPALPADKPIRPLLVSNEIQTLFNC